MVTIGSHSADHSLVVRGGFAVMCSIAIFITAPNWSPAPLSTTHMDRTVQTGWADDLFPHSGPKQCVPMLHCEI